jgi:hypothetical protein
MDLFELSKIIGTKGKAPVNLDAIPRDDVPIFCQYVDRNRDTGYIGQGIHFPDWSVEDFYKYRLATSIYDIELVEQILQQSEIISKYEKIAPIIYVAFIILHEEGHWINFSNSGLDVKEYTGGDKDYIHRKRVQEFANSIISRNLSDDSELKHRLAKQYLHMYFTEIPYEAKANEYAVMRMKNVVDILKDI